MADDTAHISKTLDELRRQATAKLEEARGLVLAMNTLETMFDLPQTALADLETIVVTTPPPLGAIKKAGVESGSVSHRRTSSPQFLRPDEYLGDEPMEAAKKYIRAIGHAVHFDEIADAVQRSGAAIQGANWRDRLELSLKRSPYQVITAAEKTYGLSDFYTEEQLRRLRASRRGGESPPVTKKKAKPKAKANAKKKAERKSSAKGRQSESPTKTETAS